MESQRAALAAALTRAPADTEQHRWLKDLLARPIVPGLSPDDAEKALVNLVECSSLSPDGRWDSGFVRDAAVVRVLVAALVNAAPGNAAPANAAPAGGAAPDVPSPAPAQSADGSSALLRESAARYLLERVRPADLAEHAAEILPRLPGLPFGDGVRLHALLPLPPEQRDRLLARGDLPPEVRARLGDAAAERALIRALAEAPTCEAARPAIARLSYLATPAAAKALAARLGAPLTEMGRYEQISISYYVLAGLSRCYPDEPLVTTDLARLQALGDDQAGADELKAYWSRVREWASRTLEAAVPPDPPRPFYRRPIVKMK